MDAIVVEGLEKRYKEVQALDGVSFAVREGEVFGLLGPNGAGKSTTVRILATLTEPDAGRAEVAGHDVRREAGAVRARSATSRRTPASTSTAPAARTCMLQGRVQGMGGASSSDRVAELLELVGIADAADRIVQDVLGRHAPPARHRARARPPPAGAVPRRADDRARPGGPRRMWDEVGRLAAPGELTILLTTHYLEEADELADRLAIVSRGQIVVEGTPRELKATLRGDAVHLELADGRMDDARRVRRASRRDARERRRRPHARRARRERRPRPARASSPRSSRRGSASSRSASRARRSTTSTSTTPAATSPPRTGGEA